MYSSGVPFPGRHGQLTWNERESSIYDHAIDFCLTMLGWADVPVSDSVYRCICVSLTSKRIGIYAHLYRYNFFKCIWNQNKSICICFVRFEVWECNKVKWRYFLFLLRHFDPLCSKRFCFPRGFPELSLVFQIFYFQLEFYALLLQNWPLFKMAMLVNSCRKWKEIALWPEMWWYDAVHHETNHHLKWPRSANVRIACSRLVE